MQIGINRLQEKDISGALLLLLFLTVLCSVAAFSVVQSPYVVISLLLGSPALVFMATEKTRFVGLLVIFAAAPFMGIVKTFTGVRYAPLMLDIALYALFTSCILSRMVLSRLRLSTLSMLVLLFIALASAQILNPNMPGLLSGLEGLRPYFQAFGFFAGIWLIKSTKQIKQVVITLFCSSLLVAVYGIKQFFYPTSIDLNIINMTTASPISYTALGQMRAFSTLPGPFHLGIYMVMMILLVVLLLHRKEKRFFLISAAALYILTLLVTITRTNWIGLIGALAFYMYLLALERKVRLTFRVVLPICILITGATLLSRSHPYFSVVSDYIASIGSITETSHFKGRIEGWRDSELPAILSNPLFGYGTGSALDSFSHRSVYFTKFTSHSLYLKYALELGVTGLALYLMILYTCMKQGIKTYLRLKDTYLKSIAGWILAFIVTVSICGLSGPMLDAYPTNMFFWFMLGLLVNLKNIEMEPEPSGGVD